jgi:hypothetical protein
MTAIVWGFIVFSLAVIGTILGLSLKLISVIKERAKIQRNLDGAKVEIGRKEEIISLQQQSITRLKKGLEVLRNELEKSDSALSLDGVADRLERLLSGKMQEDDNEDNKS